MTQTTEEIIKLSKMKCQMERGCDGKVVAVVKNKPSCNFHYSNNRFRKNNKRLTARQWFDRMKNENT